MTPPAHKLADQLGKTVNAFMSSLPEDEAQIVGASFEKLHSSDTAESAIAVGEIAPNFTLSDATGKTVSLHSRLDEGPVVLSFYRGGWCPFCNLEFKSLHDILPQIKQHGAILIGVSPELPDNSMSTVEKHNLQFEVLSDVGNKVALQYGLVMKVPEVIRPLYLEWGLDIPAVNGEDTWELPIPATYVINTDGKIVSAYVNKNYTERMEPDDIIKVLETL